VPAAEFRSEAEPHPEFCNIPPIPTKFMDLR
jgi:hypothetical protein